MPKGYNMTDGGDGGGDYVLTEEERVARSERNMGDKNPNFGNRWNDQQRARAAKYMAERYKNGYKFHITEEIKKKRYETSLKRRYGKSFEELCFLILSKIEREGCLQTKKEISKELGLSSKTVDTLLKKMRLDSERSKKIIETRLHNPYIVQCDRLDHSKVLNIFPSLKEAREKTGISSIHHCTHGVQENAGGYFWRFNEKDEVPSEEYNAEFLRPLGTSRKLTEIQKEDFKKRGVWKKPHLEKKVYCFDESNKIVNICSSLKDAGEQYGVNPHTICDICLNRRKNKWINGVTFSYNASHVVESPIKKDKIVQYDKCGNIVGVYKKLKDVENNDMKASAVYACLNGISKTSYGYIWKYE